MRHTALLVKLYFSGRRVVGASGRRVVGVSRRRIFCVWEWEWEWVWGSGSGIE